MATQAEEDRGDLRVHVSLREHDVGNFVVYRSRAHGPDGTVLPRRVTRRLSGRGKERGHFGEFALEECVKDEGSHGVGPTVGHRMEHRDPSE